jgi:DNA-binding NtrC family response regulator
MPLSMDFLEIGSQRFMKDLRDDIRLAAAGDAPALITGEAGVGKESVGRYIHDRSHRRAATCVTVRCEGRTDSWLLSELFGDRRGDFSGGRSRRSRLQQAHEGSLLLHEVGAIGAPVQARLVGLIEREQDKPLRDDPTRAVADVRLIATTSRRLVESVDRNEFRDDLYYRLNIVHIRIPSLRERREDIPALIDRFLASLERGDLPEPGIAPAAMAQLQAYDWPGNMRELRLLLGSLFSTVRGRPVEPGDLPLAIRRPSKPSRVAKAQASLPADNDTLSPRAM